MITFRPKSSEDRMNNKTPNLLIVGVNKSGTTSLFNYLASHPEICGSKIKETFYFTPLVWGEELSDISDYHSQFDQCADQQYRMEATPRYFFGGDKVAKAIKEVCGDAKIIILLREPISRLFSFYQFKKRTLDLPKDIDFNTYIQNCLSASESEMQASPNKVLFGIKESQYSDQIDSWIKVIGEEKIKFIFQDDLLESPQSLLNELAEWLQLDSTPFEDLSFARENKAQSYKNAGIQKFARKGFKKFESFWTANPKIKRSIASIYYAINGSAKKEKMTVQEIAQLQEHFHPYNQKLKEQLIEIGYTQMPEWLNQG